MAQPRKEYSYGIIPLTYRENTWKVFLVHHLNGGHWGFPKGHAEKGESPKEAAERELLEETGMKVIRYLPEPYLTDSYRFHRGETLIEKTNRFYFAEVTTPYTLQKEELIEARWLPLKELLSYATFSEEKKLYLSVIHQIKS